MRRFWIFSLGMVTLLGMGCTGMQMTSMDSLVDVDPIRGASAWTPPDLANFPIAACPFVGDSPPAVDADLADWEGAGWIAVDTAEDYTGENWGGPEDASFRIAFSYDAENLYIAAEVTDDVLSQPFEGADIWKGDSFQMGFDPRLDRTRNRYADDDTEIGWSVLPGGEGVAVWRWTAASGREPGVLELSAASRTEGNVTRFELAVPIDELAQLSPGLLDRCGVSFMYNDNDSIDGGERKGYLEWTPSLGARKDPSTFGVLQLGFPPSGTFPNVVAQYRAMRTVAEQGTPIEIKMDLVAGKSADQGILSVVYEKGEDSIPLTKRPVRLQPGQQAYDVLVDTSNMEAGKASLALEFSADGYAAARTWPVYVYEPVKWGK